MAVTCSNLSHLLVVFPVDIQGSWRKFWIEMIMSQLSFVAGSPSVNLSKTGLSYSMSIATFNYINSLSNISKALNQLRKLSWISMPQTKLTFRVILAKGIHKALVAYKEAKVMSTWNSKNFSFVTKRHFGRYTLHDSVVNKRPGICITFFCTRQIEIATCSNVYYLDIRSAKGINLGRFEYISINS